MKQREALYCSALMLVQGCLLFGTEDSSAVWTEKVLRHLLTSLVRALPGPQGVSRA